MGKAVRTLDVALGDRAYPIRIGHGLLSRADLVVPYLKRPRVAIVTNDVVGPIYLEALSASLRDAGVAVTPIVLPDGEANKNWETLNLIFTGLLEARSERSVTMIALGGGVIGDMTGFAAAAYQRGVPFIQMPTTLLSQVDSSVGGKTAINHARGKNMIGAFHQPLTVISDVATLDSLPERELRSGLAEVIKHGAALDQPFFDWLESHIERLLARERDALIHAVRRSCELKAAVVAEDERETGRRALLNLGHTFGHAIEAATGFGPWLHGEAVAAGMVMAAELSARAGLLARPDAKRISALISRAGLPIRAPQLARERWHELISLDKKSAAGRVRFVLLDAIGRASLRADVDPRLVDETIAAAA